MAGPEFEWHPAKLLQDHDSFQDFALLVLNQPLKNGSILRRLWKNCKYYTIVALDFVFSS